MYEKPPNSIITTVDPTGMPGMVSGNTGNSFRFLCPNGCYSPYPNGIFAGFYPDLVTFFEDHPLSPPSLKEDEKINPHSHHHPNRRRRSQGLTQFCTKCMLKFNTKIWI